MLQQIAQSMFQLGMRSTLAALASAYYRRRTDGRQCFAVSEQRHWLNRYDTHTIASNRVHTASYPAYREWVLDNWCFGYMPRGGDLVVDLGAGVGEEAVIFSELVGKRGRVVSIEAHPMTFECLLETVRLSKLRNVLPLAVAVGRADGNATITDGDDYIANSIVTSEAGKDVPLRSLDSLADELGWDEVSLLRMNIEGAEAPAIEGMTRLATRVKHIAVSCHDFIADRGGGEEFRTFHRVRKRLQQLGFVLTTRSQVPRPWMRYYIYARNPKLAQSPSGV